MASSVYEPSPRFNHSSVQVEDNAYLWGGLTQDSSGSEVINVFDYYTESWKEQRTTGFPPPGLQHGGFTLLCDDLYYFGGYDGERAYNSLHKLQTRTLEWKGIKQANPAGGPLQKWGCGMVAYQQQLALIGGYCHTPTGPLQSGAEFIKSSTFTEYGWTNEFHLFSIKEGKWSSPPSTGPRPPPCSAFTFTAVNQQQAVMFGGYNEEHGVFDDVYIIDFSTMEWTELKPKGAPWPVGRAKHAACCLNYGNDQPLLLMTGGVEKNGNTLKDAWLFDVNSRRWRELTLPEGTQPRYGHTLTCCRIGESKVHATTFGGCPVRYDLKTPDDKLSKLANTMVLEFESVQSGDTPSSRQWELVGVADSSQLGTPERTKYLEKLKQMKLDHESVQSRDTPSSRQWNLVGVADSSMLVTSERTTELEKMKKKRTEHATGESQSVVPVVFVEKSDLQIGDELGGQVYRTRWISRNMTVALKRLTGGLEDGEASKLELLRHRNIIRFYGVVIQKPDYWMVTEYAENGSLSGFLQRNQVNIERDLKWAIEIAQGLHYLHHEAPESIIHGDLKSSNVVLTTEWTAKICDFGSARKYYHTTTKSIQGTYPWTAPEVIEEKKVSISCDIFSYGMVLWELMTHQTPFDGVRHFQVAPMIVNGERPPIPATCPLYLKHLLSQCWQHDPKERPKSYDILFILQRKSERAPHKLNPHDLAFFMEQLLPVANHWKDLGLQLGLTLKELNTVESMPLLIPDGPAAFLREMLHRWLNQAPPSHPFPTITKLCDALRSCTVREERLAYDIEQQYQVEKLTG